jgi:glutamyl-tRNA synthetase
VNSSPAFFDVKKLRAFNGEYIRALSPDAFTEACQPWLTGPKAPWAQERFDPAAWDHMAALVQTRVEVLGDVPGMVDFLFDEPMVDKGSWDKAMAAPAPALLDDVIDTYEALGSWTAEALKGELEVIGARHGLKLGKAQAPVRVAVTGRSVGPPLFESLEVLGHDRTLARLRAARVQL